MLKKCLNMLRHVVVVEYCFSLPPKKGGESPRVFPHVATTDGVPLTHGTATENWHKIKGWNEERDAHQFTKCITNRPLKHLRLIVNH